MGSIWNYLNRFKIKIRTKSELWTKNNPNSDGLSIEHRKKISIARKGKTSNHFKNGRIYNDAGYILILLPNHPFCNNLGYVREHRLIIENHINRYLKIKEVTHHINKVRDDNRIENLMLFSSHSAHIRFEKGGEVLPKEIIFDGREL